MQDMRLNHPQPKLTGFYLAKSMRVFVFVAVLIAKGKITAPLQEKV
jgi:hypothetical protein